MNFEIVKRIKMKMYFDKFIFAVLVVLSISSCESKHEGCIELMMEDGYSYNDAKQNCDDAEYENQVR